MRGARTCAGSEGPEVEDMSAAELIDGFKKLEEAEVLLLLLADQELRQDLEDSLTIEARRREPSRSLDDVLADRET